MELRVLDEKKIKTIFCDQDGCVFEHRGKEGISLSQPILPGVKQKFDEWEKKGYIVIITTARNRRFKEITEKAQLNNGLKYDDLIMNIGSGQRVLINDQKPYDGWEGKETAIAINIKRDEGLINVAE